MNTPHRISDQNLWAAAMTEVEKTDMELLRRTIEREVKAEFSGQTQRIGRIVSLKLRVQKTRIAEELYRRMLKTF